MISTGFGVNIKHVLIEIDVMRLKVQQLYDRPAGGVARVLGRQ